MAHRTIALLVASLMAAACSTEVDPDNPAGGGGDASAGGGGNGPTNAGGAGGSAGGAVDPGATLDLFGCGIVPDCVQDQGHLGEGLTEEAIRCGGELAASGRGGALLTTSQPGPYPTEIESLVVIAPDGTAYDQIRSRCAVDGQCADQNTTEWRRTELRRCVIDVDPADIEGCGADGPCEWYGQTKDCVEVDEAWTCADLPR